MQNWVEPVKNITPENKPTNKNNSTSSYFRLTLKDLLNILTAISVPIAIGIYTAVTTNQQIKTAQLQADEQQRIAHESLQQSLYNGFIDSIYKLYKDSELNESHYPWAFPNARYRAVHRQLDKVRKAHVLQFLKEKELIGRNQCQTGCEQKQEKDIIRLSGLSFDHLQLSSETGKLNQLNFKCIDLDGVSLVGAVIMNVDFSGTSFEGSNLNGAQFTGSTLRCAKFNGTQVDGADFSKSNLEHAEFANVDLSTAKLPREQIQQLKLTNVKMSNGEVFTQSGTATTKSEGNHFFSKNF